MQSNIQRSFFYGLTIGSALCLPTLAIAGWFDGDNTSQEISSSTLVNSAAIAHSTNTYFMQNGLKLEYTCGAYRRAMAYIGSKYNGAFGYKYTCSGAPGGTSVIGYFLQSESTLGYSNTHVDLKQQRENPLCNKENLGKSWYVRVLIDPTGEKEWSSVLGYGYLSDDDIDFDKLNNDNANKDGEPYRYRYDRAKCHPMGLDDKQIIREANNTP